MFPLRFPSYLQAQHSHKLLNLSAIFHFKSISACLLLMTHFCPLLPWSVVLPFFESSFSYTELCRFCVGHGWLSFALLLELHAGHWLTRLKVSVLLARLSSQVPGSTLIRSRPLPVISFPILLIQYFTSKVSQKPHALQTIFRVSARCLGPSKQRF